MKKLSILATIFTVACLVSCQDKVETITLEEHNQQVNALEVAHQAELEETVTNLKSVLENEHYSQIENLTQTHAKQIEKSRQEIEDVYATFDQMLDSGNQSLNFLDSLRSKLNNEKELSKQELEQMRIVFLALNQLKKSYEAPLSDFSNLEDTLKEQASQELPEKPKSSFFRWAFSKKHRKAAGEYEAKSQLKESYSDTYIAYQKAYGSAQAKIKEYGKDLDGTITQLDLIISGKSTLEGIDEFLNQGLKILEEHQDLAEIETTKTVEPIRQP